MLDLLKFFGLDLSTHVDQLVDVLVVKLEQVKKLVGIGQGISYGLVKTFCSGWTEIVLSSDLLRLVLDVLQKLFAVELDLLHGPHHLAQCQHSKNHAW